MTNEEFYKDELMGLAINELAIDEETKKLTECEKLSCYRCIFCTNCHDKKREWLKEEHIEQVDWRKVKIDTPIYVRDCEDDPWFPRYFAKYENGKVYAWCNGGTSFTKRDDKYWNYAELAEREG